MSKLLRRLDRGKCSVCSRYTLVRNRLMPQTHNRSQVCVICVPVDGNDLAHESSKLVFVGHAIGQ